jgi:hypothetical protein
MSMTGQFVRFDQNVTAAEIETLRLPLSGLRFQRLPDGRWRCVTPAQYEDEEAGLFVPGPAEWVTAELPIGTAGRAQWAPGRRHEVSWWVLYGDTKKRPVIVTLTDGQTPPILTFGPLWICEWVSTWQPAQVTVGDESFRAFAHRAHYLRDDDADS